MVLFSLRVGNGFQKLLLVPAGPPTTRSSSPTYNFTLRSFLLFVNFGTQPAVVIVVTNMSSPTPKCNFLFAKVLHHRTEIMAKIDENLIVHFFPRSVHKTFPCSKEFDNHGRSQSNTKFVLCKCMFWCPERTSLCTRGADNFRTKA